MKAGFAGLGNMGTEMARNLLKAGHEITLYNRTRTRAELLRGEGASVATSPQQAAATGILMTMLADDHAVEQVMQHGGFDGLPAGGLHISMSTISVALSQRLAEEHQKRGQRYISAPVFGRPEAAHAARLFIVAAGPHQDVERCKHLFAAIGQRTFHVSEHPHVANVIKLSGNFLIASMMESMSEALALVRKYGVDPHQYVELVSSSIFPAPNYKTYGGIMADEKFQPAGFKMVLGLKDLRLVLAAAESAAVPMPTASVVHDHFVSGVARGMADLDWSALARVAAEDAGLP